ncbi:hypothetical protein HanIR_Chr01g0009861 [Helianthus annuus]|nr:hypothetical protein HanIR_Chr01g0009861 [Helianthus annuus]
MVLFYLDLNSKLITNLQGFSSKLFMASLSSVKRKSMAQVYSFLASSSMII